MTYLQQPCSLKRYSAPFLYFSSVTEREKKRAMNPRASATINKRTQRKKGERARVSSRRERRQTDRARNIAGDQCEKVTNASGAHIFLRALCITSPHGSDFASLLSPRRRKTFLLTLFPHEPSSAYLFPRSYPKHLPFFRNIWKHRQLNIIS